MLQVNRNPAPEIFKVPRTPEKSPVNPGPHGHGNSFSSGSPPVKSPVKRSGENLSASGSPRKKRKNGEQLPQPKNPVALLNELRQGLTYTLEAQTGPVHAPLFTISVEVDGQTYTGQGRSKKMARLAAAEAALRSFIQLKDGAILSPLKPTNNVDFTSDEHIENEMMRRMSAVGSQKAIPEKGPVMLLYELFNDVKFECVSSDGHQHSRFKMIATANNTNFEGTGPSKKLAKNAAAKAALAALCNISYSPMQAQLPKSTIASINYSDKECPELAQTIADGIGKLVLQKFTEIMVGHEVYSRRKVLAGIVMTCGPDLAQAKVISVSTGTKCVNGEYISVSGSAVNDCHAEIVSRRCLVDYLYGQLMMHLTDETASDSIFVRPLKSGELYQLRENVQFHLYINTAPCGDARIFSPHEEDATLGIDKHPNRKARGQLRTKIESGEGTIPVKNSDGIQTWDGVLQGQRLLTMSCSDKIAKWNVLGVQGALLASIIQPIYLTSIVLGSLLHPAHMYRAVCGRIENSIQNLPPPYQLNRPKLALVTSSEMRNPIKAPNFSINWTFGNAEVEIINSITGKTIHNKISRITKQSFFARYAKLISQLPLIEKRHAIDCDYGEMKASVKEYQVAKQELFTAFKREDLGHWLKKPIEQNQFSLPQ
ncbi:double-stranded RNA-specific editase Adar isoform X2 [Phlebotomus argentipes]|uniref:double-stranded RNA-specific editase Adar isoform X2 n=1 Tax=Phlebotomus argentipes TaxID=94469 RepID=UPI0028933DDD|nr:double-stranded RNA-specific editase Adar isoform X2 [Phlebotomus argentipes]